MSVEFKTWLASKKPEKPCQKSHPQTSTKIYEEGLTAIKMRLTENKFPLLITGFRGVGRLEAVHQALEEEAFSDSKIEPSARLHLTIPLRIPRSISREALLKRLLRKIYLSLVAKSVSDVEELRPLVRRARQAYIRSAGGNIEIKDDTAKKTQQNAKATFGTDFFKWGAELGAAGESSLAHSLLEKFGNITPEELEDELEILSTELSNGSRHIQQGSVSKCAVDTINKVKEQFYALTNAIANKQATIALTVVLYEIDQITPFGDSPSDTVSCFPSLLRELRGLFGFDSKHLRLIAIGGPNTALDFLKAQLTPNSILPSLFAGHVHIRIPTELPADPTQPDLPTRKTYLETAGLLGRFSECSSLACETDWAKAKLQVAQLNNPPPIIADSVWLYAYYQAMNIRLGNTVSLSPADPDHAVFSDPTVKNWPKNSG